MSKLGMRDLKSESKPQKSLGFPQRARRNSALRSSAKSSASFAVKNHFHQAQVLAFNGLHRWGFCIIHEITRSEMKSIILNLLLRAP